MRPTKFERFEGFEKFERFEGFEGFERFEGFEGLKSEMVKSPLRGLKFQGRRPISLFQSAAISLFQSRRPISSFHGRGPI